MLRHILLPTLAAAALCAGEASPVPASLSLADGPTLTKHWDASLYGAVWNDPGLAWVRQQWSQQKAQLKTAPGIDLDTILASATGMRGEFLGMTEGPDPKPKIRAQADLGVSAKTLFGLMTTSMHAEAVLVAGADEARQLPRNGPILARHGNRLVLGYNCEAAPWAITASPADAHLAVDYRSLMKAMFNALPAKERESNERMLRGMETMLGVLNWDVSVVPQGLHEVMTYSVSFGVKPVDRAQLDRFPADALAVASIGLDLAAMWKVAGASLLDSIDSDMHHGQKLGAEATQKEIDAMLAGLGVAGGLPQLVKDIQGTCTMAVTQGIPFPGISITVPRSASVDALLNVGLASLGGQLPAEGASSVVPVPNVPLMISLARDRTHWLLSSDAQVVQTWLSGKPGGFLGSAAGKVMLAKAPKGTYMLGALDTAAALRVATPFAFMGMSQIPDLPPEVRQAVLAGLARLTRDSTPSWIWAAEQGSGSRIETTGVLGMGVAPIAIIAAIAIPNLMESRVTANEAAASATLKAGIFPAQIQFQAGAYMDQDEDNVGEYGTLAELSGRQKTSKVGAGAIRLLQGPLAKGNTGSGYHYRSYLPDGQGGALTSDDAPRAATPAAADAQERFWVVYAWPESFETGRRMFAMTSDGQVRSEPWDGQEPAWNAALANGWEGEASWPVMEWGNRGRPNRRGPAPMPAPAPDPGKLF